jgi:hypothetical protein
MSEMPLSVTQFESVWVCDACAVSMKNVSILEVHLRFIFELFLHLQRAQYFLFSPYRIEPLRYFARRVQSIEP